MRAYGAVEAALLEDIRQLADEMIRYDRLIKAAAARQEFGEVAELDYQRDLARERRSGLMRELWAGRVPVFA